MKDFNHNNTVRFIGICMDSPQNMYFVNEYYPRGSLQVRFASLLLSPLLSSSLLFAH